VSFSLERYDYRDECISTVTNPGRMAYIDSELAKRHLNAVSPITDTKSATETGPSRETAFEGAAKPTKPIERQPATLGKLLEIDLGNEARDRNVVRTEQARRRLDGEDIEDESAPERKPKKVRLGRDGKPWRERKRRTSDDIRRDKLVEEVLRENRRVPLLSSSLPLFLSSQYSSIH
jgi:Hepatocellular carcinoma-associated antigen 59